MPMPDVPNRLRRLMRSLLGPPVFDELRAIRAAIGTRPRGVLVDVGAHVGTSLRPFVSARWKVHAFEPDPINCAGLRAEFGTNDLVSIHELAIAEQAGMTLPLYTSTVSSGISTLTPFHPSHEPTAEVATARLDTVLADVGEVTVLKTDTEGHDLNVLRTFPWDLSRPRVVMSEFEDRKTNPLGYGYDDLAGFLVDHGYTVLVSEWYPVAEYGQEHRWRSIRRYPSRLADKAAWGNLIAANTVDAGRIFRLARLAGIQLTARRAVDGIQRRLAGNRDAPVNLR